MSTAIRLSGFHPDDLIRSLGQGVTVYVVGGAVRDELLGIASSDRDWVVTGATPEQMLAAGFTPVGADFPVFLHPVTHEEFALARTERKTAAGYRGFVFHAAPDVSLEADLQRRDLTVNAMAMSADGTLHDPWGGLNDLNARVLRHVSAAFAEDPVRILRLARFAARFPQFSVHADTLAFCADMVRQGEARALVAERVWQEVARLLMADAPAQGWRVLVDCGALPDVVPAQAVPLLGDVSALQILQPSEVVGASGDVGAAGAAVTAAGAVGAAGAIGVAGAANLAAWSLPQRWAAWMLAAQMSLDVTDALAARWRVPNECAELAHVCISQCSSWKNAAVAHEVATVFAMSDLYRRSERFAQAVAVMNAVAGAGAALPVSVWMQLADYAKALPVGDVAKAASASGTPVASAVAAAREAAIGQALAALLK